LPLQKKKAFCKKLNSIRKGCAPLPDNLFKYTP